MDWHFYVFFYFLLVVGDDGNVRLVIGAAGGTKITTSLVIVSTFTQ